MALNNADWRVIEDFVSKMLSKVGSPFVQGRVIKVDTERKVVFLKEFGHIPIPLVGFDYQVKYKYKEPGGAITIATTRAHSEEVEILTPQVGDLVLVAQHFGTNRLPKCLGVIQSTDYIRHD